MTSDQVDGFAGFLDVLDFDYFSTFTTRRPISLNSTRRIAENVEKFIDAGNDGSIFWAAEPFDVREGYHFHALMKCKAHPIEIFNWYYPRYGRCQIILNTDPMKKRAASYYLSKYCTKHLSDYDWKFSKDIKTRNQIEIRSQIFDL